MAGPNPTGEGRLAPLRLSAAHAETLCGEIAGWIAALAEELRRPERLRDPDRSRSELAAYRRLLAAVGTGEIAVPDRAAARALREAAEAHDAENGYAELVATHDAMHALLAALERPRPSTAAGGEGDR